ncbi:MAG: serine hydrolase [Bacteroidales bacterium]
MTVRSFLFMVSVICLTAEVNGQDAVNIRSAIDSIAREHDIPSVAFAVVNNDSVIIAGAVGYADKENNIPAISTTTYRIGSATKTFISLGIMHLVSEGKLDLDDTLSKLVPEVPVDNKWEDSHPVLLKHLLEHTAGFRDLQLKDFVIAEGTPLPGMKETVMREPDYWVSRWKPGTRNAYSNPGYSLLGYIIEKCSGKPYNEYLEDILLHPLEMDDSDFLGRDHSRLAISYDINNMPQTPLPILDHPAGYMHSTPQDMARFIRFMLLSGQVESFSFMSEERFRLMDDPSSIIGAGNNMIGYGKGLFATVAQGHVGYGHDGGIDEYLTSFVFFRDQGVAYYFTITRMDGKASSAISKYLQGILLSKKKPVSENRLEHTEAIEGWYRFGSYRLELTKILHDLFDPVSLGIKEDTLRLNSVTGESRNLISLGNGYFRTEGSPCPTHFIGEYDDKMVISSSFAETGGYFEKTSAFRAVWKTWGFIISIVVFIFSAVVYFVNYLVVRIKKREINASPMIWPALGLLTFVLILLFFSRLTSVLLIGTVNIFSVAVAIFSGIFALCFVFGFLSLRKGKTHNKAWKRVPLIMGYVAWAFIIILLASYGHMPITTWIW